MIILFQNNFNRWLCVSIVSLFIMNFLGQLLPYHNSNSEERAKVLISRLILNENATLMFDLSGIIPRMGNKINSWGEANQGLFNNFKAVVTIIASSFNNELFKDIITVLMNYEQNIKNTYMIRV